MSKTAVGLVALGLFAGACAQVQDESASRAAPPLTEQERAVVARMEQGTLAQIELPQGKLRFIEVEPGITGVVREFPLGVEVPRVDGEEEMTLDQIFRAYVPDREVPQAIFDAMHRSELAASQAVAEPGPAVVEPRVFLGEARPPQNEQLGDGLVGASFALTNQEFVRKCSYTGVDWSWCYAPAFQGAWAKHKNHRGGALTCGTEGAGRMQFFVSGTLKSQLDVPFQQCMSWSYHGPHGTFGTNLDRTMEWRISFAERTVGFTGWTKSNDGFVIIGWDL